MPVVVITGAASGIGAACAARFHEAGYDMVLNDLHPKASPDIGNRSVVLNGDVSDDQVCRNIAAEAVAAWGRIDVLVNCAGATRMTDQSDLDALDAEEFHRLYAVNVVAPYQMIRACAPALKAHGQGGGCVVNISSVAALDGLASSTAYAASKAALNTLTLSMARVLAPDIRVNAVCAGYVSGTGWNEGAASRRPEMLQRIAEATPLKRLTQAEDIAEAVFWIATRAALISGELIRIDGGMHLRPPRGAARNAAVKTDI